ncbi:MAG: MFS transporter [Bacteroidota bacterium]
MQELASLARKITAILFAQQSLASAGFIAAATLSSIVGASLASNPAYAGVPSAVNLLSGAVSAYIWGYVMEAVGRRNGLVAGLVLGAVGSGLAFYAVAVHGFLIFLGGMVLMGAANAAVALARFAAAEVHPPAERGRAISNVVIGGTVGSVIGPFVAGPAGEFFKGVAGSELAGAYAVSLLLFVLAALVVHLGLRPDPREVGLRIASEFPEAGPGSAVARTVWQVFRQPAALVALAAMLLGQMVMVLVMVITSLYMRGHHHALGDISLVISAHTFGMYAFSVLSGRLSDRWGRGPVIIFGSSMLVLACLAATLSPEVLPLGLALFLLGLGWNFCYVGGSTLLADQLSPAERARSQGFNDFLVSLASAAGSLGSGVIFAGLGFVVMALISAGVALVPLAAASFWLLTRPRLSLRADGD